LAFLFLLSLNIACLHGQYKSGFFGGPANQSFLKTFYIALIGWIKAGPPKKPPLYWSCKRLIMHLSNCLFITFTRHF